MKIPVKRPFLVNGLFYTLRLLLVVIGIREPAGIGYAKGFLSCACTNPQLLVRYSRAVC